MSFNWESRIFFKEQGHYGPNPPPLELNGSRNFAVGEKKSFFRNLYFPFMARTLPPPLMALPLKKKLRCPLGPD